MAMPWVVQVSSYKEIRERNGEKKGGARRERIKIEHGDIKTSVRLEETSQ
jgi:hypothetical protein